LDFLAADPEVPGSIPVAARFSEYQWVWNGVQPAFVRINEELLEGKVAAPVYKTEIKDRGGGGGIRRADHETPLYPQKLALNFANK
jgi:hypothetical protein